MVEVQPGLAPAVTFKGFYWIHCGEDLTSLFKDCLLATNHVKDIHVYPQTDSPVSDVLCKPGIGKRDSIRAITSVYNYAHCTYKYSTCTRATEHVMLILYVHVPKV